MNATRSLSLMVGLWTFCSSAGYAVGEWKSLGGTWRIHSGQVVCLEGATGDWGTTLLVGDSDVQDFALSARVLDLPREGGFVFRCRGVNQWLGLLFCDGTMRFYQKQGDKNKTLASVAKAYTMGKPFDVGINLVKTHLVVTIDGRERLVAGAEDEPGQVVVEWPTPEPGRIGLMSYGYDAGHGLTTVTDWYVKDAGGRTVISMSNSNAVAEFADLPDWDARGVDKQITAAISETATGFVVKGQLSLLSKDTVPDSMVRQVRWSLRAFGQPAVLTETRSAFPAQPATNRVSVGTSLAPKSLEPGLYVLTAQLENGQQRGLPAGTLVSWKVPAADLSRSTATAAWQFKFTGTRENISQLARRYLDYYEPRLPSLVQEQSRELDTYLGACAAVFGQTGDPIWAERYRRLIVEMARTRMRMASLDSDPTVQNELFPSYVFMRDKDVVRVNEQDEVAAWFAGLIPFIVEQGPPQHSRFGRMAMLARALKGTRYESMVGTLYGPAFPSARLADNAFGYARIDWKHRIFWAEAFDPEALRSPAFQEVSRSYFSIWAPNGMHPGYGDHTGASLWDTITPEWLAAHHLRNGQYKAIALRAMQFALDNDQLRELGAQPNLFLLWSRADDALKPEPPMFPSSAVPAETPTKIVLRSGWRPDDAYLLLQLAVGQHGHLDLGAVNWLIWRGKVWLPDTNYGVRDPQNHNLLWATNMMPSLQLRLTEPLQPARQGTTNTVACAFVSTDPAHTNVSWERRVVHTYSDAATPDDSTFLVTDTLTGGDALPPDTRLLWHVRGTPEKVAEGQWRFTQGADVLSVRITGGTATLEPFEEPRMDAMGTGCQPESYALCWGAPYSVLKVAFTPGRASIDAPLRAVTEFRMAR